MTNHVGIAEGEAAVLRLHHQLGRQQAQPLRGIVTLLNMALFISMFQLLQRIR
jgi:hypothetical protein